MNEWPFFFSFLFQILFQFLDESKSAEACHEFMAFHDFTLTVWPREQYNGLPEGRAGLQACIELCILSSEFYCKVVSSNIYYVNFFGFLYKMKIHEFTWEINKLPQNKWSDAVIMIRFIRFSFDLLFSFKFKWIFINLDYSEISIYKLDFTKNEKWNIFCL